MSEKAKRYAIFAIGLFINSLGVSFITTADLGTSPSPSIPYVLSLNAPLSLGQFTILFNLLIVLVQLPILKKAVPVGALAPGARHPPLWVVH